jgi:VWFA-related protein
MLVAGLFLSTLPAIAATQAPAVSGEMGETVDVEIRIVPFYAVDADGKPVFDLKQDEVEILVDGKPVPIDTFDSRGPQAATPVTPAITTAAAPVTPGASTARRTENDGSHPGSYPVPATAHRHVILFFDVAFSRVNGFQKAQAFAQKMIEDSPESDYLYLLVHDFKSGLKQELGPVTANAAGKRKVIAHIAKMKPEIGQLDAHADGSIDIYAGGPTRMGGPGDQNSPIYGALRTNSQAQLEGTARSLSESLKLLNDQFQRINEPKLMVFLSQGIDPTLYWVGSDVGLQFGTNASSWSNIKSYQFRGLHGLYDKSLRELADTGAMSLFVNLDDPGGSGRFYDTSMQHMALNSGGLYLGGVDSAQMVSRVENATAAYYEAGFYLNEQTREASRAKIDIVVNRPGVSTWSAGALKVRDTYRGLGEDARRLLIVDLIEGDAAAQRSRSRVRLDYHNLPGNVLGRSDSGKTLLRYELGWPKELAGRRVDLYNVVLEPTRRAGAPNVLRFDRKASTRVDEAGYVEVEVPDKAVFLWGIVAVEPDSGRTWYRRFHLQGKPPKS